MLDRNTPELTDEQLRRFMNLKCPYCGQRWVFRHGLDIHPDEWIPRCQTANSGGHWSKEIEFFVSGDELYDGRYDEDD